MRTGLCAAAPDATTASAWPAALRPGEAERSTRGPTVNPGFRQGLIALHEPGVKLHQFVVLRVEFDADTPTADIGVRFRVGVDDFALVRAGIERWRAVGFQAFQRSSDEIDDELPVFLIERQAASRLHRLDQLNLAGRRPAPVQAVVQQILAL